MEDSGNSWSEALDLPAFSPRRLARADDVFPEGAPPPASPAGPFSAPPPLFAARPPIFVAPAVPHAAASTAVAMIASVRARAHLGRFGPVRLMLWRSGRRSRNCPGYGCAYGSAPDPLKTTGHWASFGVGGREARGG